MNIKHFLTGVLLLLMTPLFAQNEAVKPSVVRQGTFLGISPALRDLPALSPEELALHEQKAQKKLLNPKLRNRVFPFQETALPNGPDAVWQKAMGTTDNASSTIQNWEGQASPYFPPDCSGSVGPNHYFQVVNTVFAIYSKTGTLVTGPTNLNTIFSGVTGANYNDGDPIVLYDQQVDRWFFSVFSVSGSNDYMLIAVSTTNDPTGTWYKYSFDVDDMPDYMKFGIWQDGYYMGTNTTGSNKKDIYVFQRSVMLTGGASPTMIGFDNPWRGTTIDGFNCVPPLDNDGAWAPAGSPGLFIAINDDAIGGGADQLWIYELNANWTTPSSSTWNRVQQLAVSPFDSNFGNTWSNIPQQGTSQKVDAIPMVIMNPPQYRNFGTYQTIVCCHTVDVNGSDLAGIRWYELRKTTGAWTVRQHGTYSPDATNRWMGSVMMNAAGEIGLGYSVSSTSMYPGIRYTGQTQAANAAASGIMDIPEVVIQNGIGFQSGSNRYGDYSQLSVDPIDDETFWFTTEYIGTSGSRKSRVASFQIGPIAPSAQFTASTTTPCQAQTVTFTDQTTGNPTSWAWTFTPSTVTYVGGTTSTSQNPQVQFNALGSYTVALVATNTVGNNTQTKTNYIQVNTANANFAASLTSIVVGNSTTFTDASTCNVTSWSWNFGAGATPATATTQGPHLVTYSTTGQKTVALTINGSITETKTNYVTVLDPNFNMSNTTINTCTGNFYDPGGPTGNYSNNQDFTTVFNPGTPGNSLQFVFTSFALEAQATCNYDYLKIYNGNSIAAPLIGTYCGTNSPGTVTANNATGSLTFVFHSDVSTALAGWAASISCISTGPVNPVSLTATASSSSQINLGWTKNVSNNNVMIVWSPNTSFGVPANGTAYIAGNAIAGGGTVIYNGNATTYNHTGLISSTTYYYKAYSVDGSNYYSTGLSANATTLASSSTLAVTPSNQNVTAPAGSTNFSLTSNASWSAISDVTWCTITPSGSGNGTLVANYLENTLTTPRTATITVTVVGIPTVVVTVTQSGALPTLAVTPPNQNVIASAGNTVFNVTSNSNWTATSGAIWCSVTPSGTGNGTITATYLENTTTTPRTATITVNVTGLGPVNVTVSQEGANPLLSVSPSNQNVPAPAGATSFSITTNTAWTTSSNSTWATPTASGNGNGTIVVNYEENLSVDPRVATITVTISGSSPVTVTVSQAGATTYLSVSPSSQSVTSAAGNTNFDVSSNVNWTTVSNVTWCTVTPSGSGNNQMTVTYTENLSVLPRTGVITVNGTGTNPVNVSVVQAGATASLLVTPNSQTVNYPEGTALYTVTSNASWTALSDVNWCTATPSGNGNGAIEANYSANTTSVSRTANITVTVSGITPQVIQLIQLPNSVSTGNIQGEEIRLFPNPTNGLFTISAPVQSTLEVSIHDVRGRLILQKEMNGEAAYYFDLSPWARGTYYVRAVLEGKSYAWKLVLQ
ncbi:MAG: BACON domain-containing carbohydrate-binding protein [Bacteroidales bacterium]|nr:BACON domain-containing carbohydrate-binding protein [Bacteroidales bacterium]